MTMPQVSKETCHRIVRESRADKEFFENSWRIIAEENPPLARFVAMMAATFTGSKEEGIMHTAILLYMSIKRELGG